MNAPKLKAVPPRNPEHVLERLELAIASSGSGVWEFDMATQKFSWDEQMYKLYGAPEGQADEVDNIWPLYVIPEDQELSIVHFNNALETDSFPLYEFRVVRGTDKAIRFLEGTGRLFRDAQGRPTTMVGMNRDITARKFAEIHQDIVSQAMTLIAEKKPLGAVLDAILNGVQKTSVKVQLSILLLDRTGHYFDFGAGAALKPFYDEVVAGHLIDDTFGSCGPSVITKQRVVTEDVSTHPNWAPYRAHTKAAGIAACWSQPIVGGDDVLGTFAMYHENSHAPTVEDVMLMEATAKLIAVAIQYSRAEAALEEQRAKLVSSVKMAALGEMASGVAHEINNPLAIIVGRATLLKERFEQKRVDKATFERDLGKIVDTSHRIAKVISGLRSFARNAEKDPLETVAVRQVIEDALELSRERFKNHGIEISLEMDDAGLCSALRPSQITQVILNLLNNAFDVLQPAPIKEVVIRVAAAGSNVQIAVTDSGPGIAPEVAEKLMQPFFTTKEVGKGTGLGLSISKGIVEDHGGRFYFDREAPRTRFVIELPSVSS